LTLTAGLAFSKSAVTDLSVAITFESTARPVWTSSEPDGPPLLVPLTALDAPLQPAKASEIETAAAAIAKRDFIVVPHVNELVGSLDAESEADFVDRS
jgi:hypothetical protein